VVEEKVNLNVGFLANQPTVLLSNYCVNHNYDACQLHTVHK